MNNYLDSSNLIAEFMPNMVWIIPGNPAYPPYWRRIDKEGLPIKDFKAGKELTYHYYWNELMSVVDYIESLQGEDGRGKVNYVVTIDSSYCVISLGGEEIVADYQGENRMDSTYQAVIKFITATTNHY